MCVVGWLWFVVYCVCVGCLLFVVRCVSPVAYGSVYRLCCLLFVVCCCLSCEFSLCDVGRILAETCCLMIAACVALFVVVLWCVVRCLLFVVWIWLSDLYFVMLVMRCVLGVSFVVCSLVYDL